MPRLRRVSAKTFSSIFPCLRSSICCSKMSISRPSSLGIFPASSSFQLKPWSIKPPRNEASEITSQLIHSLGNGPKKFCPSSNLENSLNVVHQRSHLRLTQICQGGFFEHRL